jgi:2-C-methyl-D-erythritol 4-phosphate cytidylyltransferase
VNAGLVLAGGVGTRLTSGIPKQFIEVAGKPLIMYCLMSFERCADISFIEIVAAEAWRDRISEWIEYGRIRKFRQFAAPGPTRAHSVRNGLLALSGELGAEDTIVIHDAARPLVTEADISRCVKASVGRDGATPVVRPRDTVYRSADGERISALLNRDELFAGQTPECYNFTKYLAAHRAPAEGEPARATGGSEIAFRSGMDIRLYEGNERNIKVTTEADLMYVKYLLGVKRDEGVGTARHRGSAI